jgi:hypothetical protein
MSEPEIRDASEGTAGGRFVAHGVNADDRCADIFHDEQVQDPVKGLSFRGAGNRWAKSCRVDAPTFSA